MTPASVPFVDLAAEYRAIAPEIQRRIERVLLSAQFVLGETVQEFEEMFAEFVQTD
jgi:dTDP-4-amino-4,6-dideoxygalactose transaminase